MFLQHEYKQSSQQLIYVWNKFLIKKIILKSLAADELQNRKSYIC